MLYKRNERHRNSPSVLLPLGSPYRSAALVSTYFMLWKPEKPAQALWPKPQLSMGGPLATCAVVAGPMRICTSTLLYKTRHVFLRRLQCSCLLAHVLDLSAGHWHGRTACNLRSGCTSTPAYSFREEPTLPETAHCPPAVWLI